MSTALIKPYTTPDLTPARGQRCEYCQKPVEGQQSTERRMCRGCKANYIEMCKLDSYRKYMAEYPSVKASFSSKSFRGL